MGNRLGPNRGVPSGERLTILCGIGRGATTEVCQRVRLTKCYCAGQKVNAFISRRRRVFSGIGGRVTRRLLGGFMRRVHSLKFRGNRVVRRVTSCRRR